jgi:hypothetical protein
VSLGLICRGLEAFPVSSGRRMCLLSLSAGPGSVPCVSSGWTRKNVLKCELIKILIKKGMLSLLRVNKIS